MNICTKCGKTKSRIVFQETIHIQLTSGLVGEPTIYSVRLCSSCRDQLFWAYVNNMSKDELKQFVRYNAKQKK